MTIVAIDASARGSVRFGILETEKNGLSRGGIATERRVRGSAVVARRVRSISCEDRSNFIESLCCISTSPIMMNLYLAITVSDLTPL
jgi:hypothetical protein